MSKINFEDIESRYKTALEEKRTNTKDVASAIVDNELADKFVSVQKEKEKIASIEDLHKYKKNLKFFFDEVYRIITAPGVQKFIDWLEELSPKGLETKTRNQITDLLIKEYAEYDEDIKSIVSNKEVIKTNNSLFENIKKSVKENIYKRIINSLTSKEKVEEELPDFIEGLKDLLEGLSEIEELGFVKVKNFYTNNLDEKDDDDYKPEIDEEADFYFDLIKQIVEKKDFLTTNQEYIKLSTIVENVKGTIGDIRKSIEILKSMDVSIESEDNIKILYNKFKEKLNFKTGQDDIASVIQESIDDTWEKIIKAYNTCQSFYSKFNSTKVDKLKNRKEKWINFEFANHIDNYISNLETIIIDNPIDTLKTDDITKIKSRFVKIANKIGTLEEDNPKESIIEYFSNVTSDFKNKKIEILRKLKIPESEIEKIKSVVDEINNFIENIKNSENLLNALNDDFVDGIIDSYNYIIKKFTSAIEKSDIKDDLEYLNQISSDEYVLSKTDLEDNIERLKKLLDYDLININLTKNI